MIVTQQVENAVDEQDQQLLRHRPLVETSLCGGHLQRDHDIAQEGRVQIAADPFQHRKGKHIGWPVNLPVCFVIKPDAAIIHKDKADLPFFKLLYPKNLCGPKQNFLLVQGIFPLLVLN